MGSDGDQFGTEPVSRAQAESGAQDKVDAVGLLLEDGFASLGRQQPGAGQLTAAGHDGLDQSHGPGIAVSVGGRDLGPAPGFGPRFGPRHGRIEQRPAGDGVGQGRHVDEAGQVGRDHPGHAGVLLGRETDVEVSTERSGDLG